MLPALCLLAMTFLDRRSLPQIITQRSKFDHIIIETTGLADPRPIIDIFTLSQLTDCLKLDGVVTLVDAKNIERHLDDSRKSAGAVNEALQQIAYADRIVLNKTDLVSAPCPSHACSSSLTGCCLQ